MPLKTALENIRRNLHYLLKEVRVAEKMWDSIERADRRKVVRIEEENDEKGSGGEDQGEVGC